MEFSPIGFQTIGNRPLIDSDPTKLPGSGMVPFRRRDLNDLWAWILGVGCVLALLLRFIEWLGGK